MNEDNLLIALLAQNDAENSLAFETTNYKTIAQDCENLIAILEKIKREKIITDSTISSFDEQVQKLKDIFQTIDAPNADPIFHKLNGIRKNYYENKFKQRRKIPVDDFIQNDIQEAIDYFKEKAENYRIQNVK